jgi:hypothetical protein
MMQDLAIYLDLDGVVADYDAGIRRQGFSPDPAKKNELNRSGSNDPFKRAMYDAIQGTNFYRWLPYMPGAVKLYQGIAAADPIILTAAPKFGATEEDYFLNPYWLGAAYHKRGWVEHMLLPDALPRHVVKWGMLTTQHETHIAIPDERFICTTSSRKHEFIGRKKSDHQILIDDRRDNCVRWARAGGVAILHTSADLTLEALADYKNGDPGATFALVPGGGLIAGLTDIRTWSELEQAAERNP